jgi:hypothetical protein
VLEYVDIDYVAVYAMVASNVYKAGSNIACVYDLGKVLKELSPLGVVDVCAEG